MSSKITARDVMDARDKVHDTRLEWAAASARLDSASRLLAFAVDEAVKTDQLTVVSVNDPLAKWRSAHHEEREEYLRHMAARGRWQRLQKEHAAQQMTMDELVRRAVGDDE